jgi:hypothetical protein
MEGARRFTANYQAAIAITALTWALEIGDVSRFRSVKQAISYCGGSFGLVAEVGETLYQALRVGGREHRGNTRRRFRRPKQPP